MNFSSAVYNFNFIPRIFPHQDIPLLMGRDMRIDLRCHNRAVSKNLLDIADIHILFQQKRGKGMAEHMRRNMLGKLSRIRVAVDHKPDGLLGKASAETVAEEKSGVCNLLLKKVPVNLKGG